MTVGLTHLGHGGQAAAQAAAAVGEAAADAAAGLARSDRRLAAGVGAGRLHM